MSKLSALMLVVSFAAFAFVTIVGLNRSEAQTDWQDLGSINGCDLHKRGACYVLTCDSEQAALSCR